MKTGLLILLLELANSATHMKQYFIREPDNQTAIEGEQVTLPCRVENKIGLLQWTRDGFGLGDTRQLSGYSRYRLVGSDDEKDWTLQISPVLLEDDALFQCQVGAADSVAPVRSRNAQLTVYVPPEDPYIVQGDLVEATEDVVQSLECVSPGGKPAADIYWHDGDGHVIIKNVRTKTTKLEDEKRFNTTSTVTFMPKKKHHNKTFTCSASNIADRSRRSVSILLYVRYAPSVRLTPSQGLLREGETVQFKCHAHANPSPLEYSWFVDGQRANGFESDFFLIANISQSYHNAIVKCEVRNEIGKSEETETIQVRYGPRIIAHPQTTSGDLGDTVTLHCNVDSNPPPTYTWTKGLTRQAVGSSQNLTVIVSQRTEGQYYCHSITDGFDLVTTQPASILLRGRPSITSPSAQQGVVAESVQLRCAAISAPEATGVIWTYMGRTVTSGNPKYEILSNRAGYTFQSTLIIRDATSEDFGYYGCAVTNSMGSDELSIHLEMQEEFPMLIILIGIFATIIVILLITLGFLLCRRKLGALCRQRAETDKPYKQNNLNSISPPGLASKTTVPAMEDDCWEQGDNTEDIYAHRLHGYSDQEFPPKPDLISSGYVPYGTYVRDYNPPFPPSDSQTSLHSASQLAPNNRHSTILNVTDPRYSATYGNPYLRSPPKHSQYSTFSPTESSSTVYPSSNCNGHTVSLIPSPASTNTVNSVVSYPRSNLDTPPCSALPRSLANTPPLHTVPEASHVSTVPRSLHNGHNGGGGSIMGIGPGSSSPQLLHRQQPVSTDLYAVVSKPGVVSFRNNLNPISCASVSMPNPNLDQSMISTLAESIGGQVTSPVNYILDTNPSNTDTGTHV